MNTYSILDRYSCRADNARIATHYTETPTMLSPTKAKASFSWEDPFHLDAQLTDDERAVRDAAHAYCQERLAPRVVEAFRHEKTDPAIFRGMG